MSLIQELEDLIRRTGSHRDRELLTEVLKELMKRENTSTWGFFEERKITRL